MFLVACLIVHCATGDDASCTVDDMNVRKKSLPACAALRSCFFSGVAESVMTAPSKPHSPRRSVVFSV